MEEKRHALRQMIKRNEVNCRKALNATDLGSAGRTERSMKVTVPKEFNLSRGVPRTPRSDYAPSDSESDAGELSCHRSTGTATKPRASTPTRWKPQLTVPKAPELRADRRVSLGPRRASSCPPKEEAGALGSACHAKTAAREGTPESRRREAFVEAAVMERHSAATTARAAGGTASGASTPRAGGPRTPRAGGAATFTEEVPVQPPVARPLKSSKQTGSVQERAERARLQAQQRKDAEARAANEKVCVFRKSAAQAGHAKATPRLQRSISQDAADMLSVGSRHSVRSTTSATSASMGKGGVRPRRPSFGSAAERPCCTPR